MSPIERLASGDATLSVSQSALAREVGEEVVILDLASGTYFGLDPVGTRIWTLLNEGHSPLAIRDLLAAEYDVETSRAEADVYRLVGELHAAGLVTIA